MTKTSIKRQIQNIRISIERWIFRMKYISGERVDLERSLKAIEKADKLSKKRKCRLWVIRIMPGKFRICCKAYVKHILRVYGMKAQINMYELGDVIVHITK